MSNLDVLEAIPVHRTPLGTGYVLMAEVPQPWRDLGWEQTAHRRVRWIIASVGDAAFIEEWRDWIDSLPENA
ncbi:hypothetical protein AT984_19740 [Paucibacter sp. KCTC 42545]|nr:hypothetical protein AT984_19740 [Paucibacter sp. KCTC 42545]